MTKLANERVGYHNGEYLPESRVVLPFRDRGFVYGDGVFDTARTFGHRLFHLEAHIARLYRSLPLCPHRSGPVTGGDERGDPGGARA